MDGFGRRRKKTGLRWKGGWKASLQYYRVFTAILSIFFFSLDKKGRVLVRPLKSGFLEASMSTFKVDIAEQTDVLDAVQ